MNNDGKVDVADHVELSKIIMASRTNPDPGTDPTPVNPSGDDLETDKIKAMFTRGACSSINGKIQSGSKLNVKFFNLVLLLYWFQTVSGDVGDGDSGHPFDLNQEILVLPDSFDNAFDTLERTNGDADTTPHIG